MNPESGHLTPPAPLGSHPFLSYLPLSRSLSLSVTEVFVLSFHPFTWRLMLEVVALLIPSPFA